MEDTFRRLSVEWLEREVQPAIEAALSTAYDKGHGQGYGKGRREEAAYLADCKTANVRLADERNAAQARIKELDTALSSLFLACQIADADGDLSARIDGKLLDAAHAALGKDGSCAEPELEGEFDGEFDGLEEATPAPSNVPTEPGWNYWRGDNDCDWQPAAVWLLADTPTKPGHYYWQEKPGEAYQIVKVAKCRWRGSLRFFRAADAALSAPMTEGRWGGAVPECTATEPDAQPPTRTGPWYWRFDLDDPWEVIYIVASCGELWRERLGADDGFLVSGDDGSQFGGPVPTPNAPDQTWTLTFTDPARFERYARMLAEERGEA